MKKAEFMVCVASVVLGVACSEFRGSRRRNVLRYSAGAASASSIEIVALINYISI